MTRNIVPFQLTQLFWAAIYLLLASQLALPALADEVVVANGDRLNGEVIRHDTDSVHLKTTYAGTLEIEWTQVVEVNFDQAETVLMENGETMQVESFKHHDDMIVMSPTESTGTVTIPASNVRTIKPEPWELGVGSKRTGHVNVSVDAESGNSESEEFDLDFQFNNRWRENNTKVFGQIEYDTTRGATSTDNWSVMAVQDRTFSGAWYYAGSLMLKRDRFADLNLRTMVGPGLGYRFFDSEVINLRLEGGPYYLKDDFYDQSDDEFWGLAWYMDYNQFVFKQRLQLYHRQFGFSALNTSGKHLWRSWTGIRLPLIAGLVGSVEYEIDYDSEPAIEAETTDQNVKLKLGYKW